MRHVLLPLFVVLVAVSIAIAAHTGTSDVDGDHNTTWGKYYLPFDSTANPPTFLSSPPSFFRPADGGPDVPLGDEDGPDVIYLDNSEAWNLLRIRRGGWGPQRVVVSWTLDLNKNGKADAGEPTETQDL